MDTDVAVSLISLGCPKNAVDSEILLGLLAAAGYRVVADDLDADVVVVNTCCFIEPATEESTEVIRGLERRRREGSLRVLIVAGCLPQRFRDACLDHRFPWVDAFLGPGDVPYVVSVLEHCLAHQRVTRISPRPTWLYDHRFPRVRVTPAYMAYVKIADGCSHGCSFCLIPRLRGRQRSRRMKSVIEEVRWLSESGDLREINLVAQDTTAYGRDLYGRPRLADLLRRIAREDRVPWIRLMYAYPSHFSRALIDVMASEPSICKYVDLPLQHCNDQILKRMRRGVTRKTILHLLDRLRSSIPGLSLRTTLMVGFPGETEAQFRELVEFVATQRFERLGVFPFWAEEGVPATGYPDPVPEEVKQERVQILMILQQTLSLDRNRARIGEVVDVLIEGRHPEDASWLRGRTGGDAPEIDAAVLIPGGTAAPGDFVRVKITGAKEYDLVGEILSPGDPG